MLDKKNQILDDDLDEVVGGLMLNAGVVNGLQKGKAEGGSTNLLGKNVGGGITNALAGGTKKAVTPKTSGVGKAKMPTEEDIIRVSGGTSGMV